MTAPMTWPISMKTRAAAMLAPPSKKIKPTMTPTMIPTMPPAMLPTMLPTRRPKMLRFNHENSLPTPAVYLWRHWSAQSSRTQAPVRVEDSSESSQERIHLFTTARLAEN